MASLSVERLHDELQERGLAVLPGLVDGPACRSMAELYEEDRHFRKRVVMARHGFGRGEYKYFRYPLPPLVQELRASLYAALVETANRWNERMGFDVRYPAALGEFSERCRAAGQDQPTPLVLRYAAGDYNRLHQDVYGEHIFPMQVVVLLSAPERDFTGGELVLTEQRPRMQSTPVVVPLGQGDGAVLPVRHRPGLGARGYHRVQVRHGVSQVRSGYRSALGIIFHDATG